MTTSCRWGDRLREVLIEELGQLAEGDHLDSVVDQSWGTGSLTTTSSIHLGRTEQEAREHTQKRMREQSEKISTDIRNSYKTTKTFTETTDVSSKRWQAPQPMPPSRIHRSGCLSSS